MGSLLSNITCLRCTSKNCEEDFYYKSGEIYTFCLDCGYTHNITLVKDREGNPIKDTKGEYVWNEKKEKPYGILMIQGTEGGSCSTMLEEKNYDDFKKEFLSTVQDSPNLVKITFKSFSDNTKERTEEVLYDSTDKQIKETYGEFTHKY